MSADDDGVRHELTVQILTQIRDSLDIIRRKQETFGEDLHNLSTRIVVLEERNSRMDRLEAGLQREMGRVDVLMRDKDTRDGAISAWAWISRNWPFAGITAVLGALIAWANNKI